MSDFKTHYTAQELIGLPGMSVSRDTDEKYKVRAIQIKAKNEKWQSRIRPGRGGRFEYALDSLPARTREHLQNSAIATYDEKVSNVPFLKANSIYPVVTANPLQGVTTLKKWQTECMNARIYIIGSIEQATAEGQGVTSAISNLVKKTSEGKLRPDMQAMVAIANQRSGKDSKKNTLSERTIYNWLKLWNESGGKPESLSPADVEECTEKDLTDYVNNYFHGSAASSPVPANIPSWLPWILDSYRKPQKPSKSRAIKDMNKILPKSIAKPSLDQVCRIFKKIPVVMLERYRRSGAEYKQLLGYVDRDASEFDPFTICQIDGHSFKAYVAHPTTGAHFHPEVCGVICLSTKVLAGWSWGIAESQYTVSDAFRHACTISEDKPWGGVMAILESDKGPGNMAKVNSDKMIGLFFRVGSTFIPPEEGGNPQANGGIERANQSIWINAAKSLPTYTGKDMDRTIRKKIYKKLENDLKETDKQCRLGTIEKTSKLLLTPSEFNVFLRDEVINYNNTPHSALPKITAPPPDDPNGKAKRRNMTPFEALAKASSEGWQPVRMSPEIQQYIFMPREQIKVRREKFTLRGNSYHAYELQNYHLRNDLIAAFDIHKPEHVWVLDGDERFICMAKWNGNRKYARPISVVQRAIINRANQQTINLNNKLEMIELSANPAVEALPLHIELSTEVIDFETKEQIRKEKLATSRIYYNDMEEFYDDILRRQRLGQASDYEIQWANDHDLSTGLRRVGLYLSDPYCEGRFGKNAG
jgi:putative transposase